MTGEAITEEILAFPLRLLCALPSQHVWKLRILFQHSTTALYRCYTST